jgi:hypothetical protein
MKRALAIRLIVCVSLFAIAIPIALAVILPRYSVSADEQEVTDSQTKLIWRRCAEGEAFSDNNISQIFMCMGTASVFTHEAALQYASAEASGSGKAWRLPNVKELSSLFHVPQPNPIYFPCFPCSTLNNYFWSSTPGDFPDSAWAVYDSNWFVGSLNRTSTYAVWLVRDAQ